MSKLFRATHYSRFTIHVFVLLCLFFTSCASNYYGKIKSVHTAYSRGEYQLALDKIEKINPSEKDEFLYLMDKGMILHALEKYEDSNNVLKEAEDISDVYSVKSASREIGSTLFSEEGVEYAGDKHERMIIPVIRMLNYIMLDDWSGALVEVRRLETLSEKIYGKANLYDNAFATYLSAIIWETTGKINDALIDYKKLIKDKKNVPYYSKDADVLSKNIGLPLANVPKSNISWQTTPNYRKDKSELILIANVGLSPYYVSESVSTGYFTVSLPSVRMVYPPINNFNVYIDGKQSGETYPFYNIVDDIMIALKERQKRTMVRKMIKLTVQTGLYAGANKLTRSDDTEDQLAGLAMAIFGITMSATDKADERSVRTLPYQIQLARFYLQEGEHDLRVVSNGSKVVEYEKRVDVKKGKPYVWLINASSVHGLQKKLIVGLEDKRIKDLKEKERHLEKQILNKPADGELKLELAETKMLLGNFNVERLIHDALGRKADKEKADLYYVIMYTVLEEYSKALNVSKSDFYKESLDYILNNGKKPDLKNKTFGKTIDLKNAFNYFIVGIVYEKDRNYEKAVEYFAGAYKYGLIGKQIDAKLVDNYKLTSDKFKKSKKGVEIASDFADVFLQDK